ncbi:hypothetical protein J6590_092397 [Homalodisca vitripennis]|nr:hypothetical protein J6590_092397 [Homalodisca vitripennis]
MAGISLPPSPPSPSPLRPPKRMRPTICNSPAASRPESSMSNASSASDMEIPPKYLLENKVNFFTRSLPGTSPLKVTISGLPPFTTPEPIADALVERNFAVGDVFKLKTSRVKPYRKPPGLIQCHRCQHFGHGSDTCGREQRCMRCGGPHNATIAAANQCHAHPPPREPREVTAAEPPSHSNAYMLTYLPTSRGRVHRGPPKRPRVDHPDT